MDRPKTTLFMLMSVDGKISTGDSDTLDFDQDLPKLTSTKRGLHQYYELEKQTDLFSFNTGRVMAKIGANTNKTKPAQLPLTFVIVDNKPHLTASGVRWLSRRAKHLILVSTNKKHPASVMGEPNLRFLHFNKVVDFSRLFGKLKSEFGAKSMTIQSGGMMNTKLVRDGLIDYVAIVVAPILVGGKFTPTLMDGESLHRLGDLKRIKGLKLVTCKPLKNNYLYLKYKLL